MPLRRRSVVLSYSLSGLLHAGLAAALLATSIPAMWNAVGEPIDTAVRPSNASQPDEPPLPIEQADIAQDDDPVRPGEDALAEADAGDSGLAEFTRQQLQQAREQLADRPADEQTLELKNLARRLGSVSSEQSLEQLTDTIAPWLGIEGTRATEPIAKPDEEPFDPDTAQVSDVLKRESSEGIQYVAVLVDADGRSLETPLDEAEGVALFDVFQLMKKFPLLEAVYRRTVMGLLDQLIEEQQSTETPAESDDRGEQQQQDGRPATGAG